MATDSAPDKMERHRVVTVKTNSGAYVETDGYRICFCEQCYIFLLELWIDSHCGGWRT